MDTLTAGIYGILNRGKEQMVFDWDKAARLIRESKCSYAMAGLRSDFGNTGDVIYKDGKPNLKCWTYLASTWAVPELELYYDNKDWDENDSIPCYKMQHEVPDWNSGTKWPESSLKILNDE